MLSPKAAAIRSAIKAAGARLWFTPPYSPDLNPIEQAFSKIKHGVAGSHPFKAKTIGRAHADAAIDLHLHGRSGSAFDPRGYAASQI